MCIFRYRLQASFILNPHKIDLISENSLCRVHILLSLNEKPIYVTSRITVFTMTEDDSKRQVWVRDSDPLFLCYRYH